MAGYLVKQGHRLKSWHRRFVVADVPALMLRYFKEETSLKELGAVPLAGARVNPECALRPCCFEVTTAAGVHYPFQAPSRDSLDQWVGFLRSAIGAQRSSRDVPANFSLSLSPTPDRAPPRPPVSKSPAGARSPAGAAALAAPAQFCVSGGAPPPVNAATQPVAAKQRCVIFDDLDGSCASPTERKRSLSRGEIVQNLLGRIPDLTVTAAVQAAQAIPYDINRAAALLSKDSCASVHGPIKKSESCDDLHQLALTPPDSPSAAAKAPQAGNPACPPASRAASAQAPMSNEVPTSPCPFVPKPDPVPAVSPIVGPRPDPTKSMLALALLQQEQDAIPSYSGPARQCGGLAADTSDSEGGPPPIYDVGSDEEEEEEEDYADPGANVVEDEEEPRPDTGDSFVEAYTPESEDRRKSEQRAARDGPSLFGPPAVARSAFPSRGPSGKCPPQPSVVDSPIETSIRIVGAVMEADHIEYIVQVSAPDSRMWQFQRRYRVFFDLHNQLRRELPDHVMMRHKLPGKRLLMNTTKAFVNERRLLLEHYLRELHSDPLTSRQPALCHFLEYDTHCPELLRTAAHTVATSEQAPDSSLALPL